MTIYDIVRTPSGALSPRTKTMVCGLALDNMIPSTVFADHSTRVYASELGELILIQTKIWRDG